MTEEKRIDHMTYLPGMEILDSDMLDQVVPFTILFITKTLPIKTFMALSKERLDPRDFMALYRQPRPSSKKWPKAHLVTRHFGNNISS